jgi:hypothetical protein
MKKKKNINLYCITVSTSSSSSIILLHDAGIKKMLSQQSLTFFVEKMFFNKAVLYFNFRSKTSGCLFIVSRKMINNT